MKQELMLKKETKGTFVYECTEDDFESAAVTVIYIKKRAFKTPPAAIILTIEPKE